jgi:hypothetical protein
VRIAFGAAVQRLARHVVAAGSTDWTKTVNAAIRELSPPMYREISSCNEAVFQAALWNAVHQLQASTT